MQLMFKKRHTIKEVEEGKYLSPKFDENGLIPVITTDFKTGNILMHGYMNYEALKKTIETKEAHYWSRSRKKIWRKGQVSGFIQKVKEIRIDDDQDSVWLSVDIGNGSSCHVGYRSCFYRSIPLGKIKNEEELEMEFKEKEKIFDPEIPVNIYELGLIYKIEVDETNKVNIDMTLTSPNCPVAESLPKEVKDNIMKVEGVSDVNLNLVWEPPWDKDKMSEAAKLELNI